MAKQGNQKIKIILSGGGTGGSVTPLLAIAQELKEDSDFDFLWVGTKEGPEIKMVKDANIRFISIHSGKLRRYFSINNFIDIFKIILGFVESLYLVLKYKPNLMLSAGSFVSVPLAYASWMCRVPIIIHQQDVRPGLANKLMAPLSKIITVTFEKSLKDYGKKAILVGNPVRRSLKCNLSQSEAKKKMGLKENFPVCLVIGGGTGAEFFNKLVLNNLDKLSSFCQILHITGKGKKKKIDEYCNYYVFEFLDSKQLSLAYRAAEVVVSRCGMGVLTELSFFAKPSILIPIPDSHQEDNAKVFQDKKAAIVLNQKEMDDVVFVETIKKILDNYSLQQKLSARIRSVIKSDAANKIKEIIINFLK